MRIRIIRKNDDYNLEYQIGDEFETTGIWYGGVHIKGKTGVPVSLDKNEYEVIAETTCTGNEMDDVSMLANGSDQKTVKKEQDNEPVEADDPSIDPHGIVIGSIVQHFKRENVSQEGSEYLYKILAIASHTETGEKLVIYQGMYAPFKICARPYAMFMSEVDREKYPKAKQKYRFELYQD